MWQEEELGEVIYIGWAEGCFAGAVAAAADLRAQGRRVEVALAPESEDRATSRKALYVGK